MSTNAFKFTEPAAGINLAGKNDADAHRLQGTYQERGTTATRTSTTGTASASILAANAARVRALFFNNGDVDYLLGEGTATVTSADNTVRIPPGGSYMISDYRGAVHGLFVSTPGSGQLNITEITF